MFVISPAPFTASETSVGDAVNNEIMICLVELISVATVLFVMYRKEV